MLRPVTDDIKGFRALPALRAVLRSKGLEVKVEGLSLTKEHIAIFSHRFAK